MAISNNHMPHKMPIDQSTKDQCYGEGYKYFYDHIADDNDPLIHPRYASGTEEHEYWMSGYLTADCQESGDFEEE
jgi:hypothetical protein